MGSENFRALALALALASGVLHLAALALLVRLPAGTKEAGTGRRFLLAALGALLLSGGAVGGALGLRADEVGHAPFQTVYEILMYVSLCVCLCVVVVVAGNRLLDGTPRRSAVGAALGSLASGLVAGILGPGMTHYGDTGLSLPPALQSVFFVPHVAVYVCGYGAASVAALAALLHLLTAWEPIGSRLGGEAGAAELDRLAYRNVVLAFPFLTLGLALGTAWAWYAWADYWGWDNKEVWALASWLVFVVYLHLRRIRGFKGRRSSWFIVSGGLAIAFTLLLFGYLPASHFSVHKYAG